MCTILPIYDFTEPVTRESSARQPVQRPHLVQKTLKAVNSKIQRSSGLPDGLLSNQISQFGPEGLRWEIVGIFYGH
jgi:hypothetical protein